MSQIQLNLLVLKTANITKTLAFYTACGLDFEQECHDQGIIHYACTLGTMVIEIYPGNDGFAPGSKQGGATMLGFGVESIDAVITQLQKIGNIKLPDIKLTRWGRRIVVEDPDGRKVELIEL